MFGFLDFGIERSGRFATSLSKVVHKFILLYFIILFDCNIKCFRVSTLFAGTCENERV
jgi:hypothetical protein